MAARLTIASPKTGAGYVASRTAIKTSARSIRAIGAIGGLVLTHRTLHLFSLIGTILLIGIATKNGILLVDYANALRQRGLNKLSAIKESAHVRAFSRCC